MGDIIKTTGLHDYITTEGGEYQTKSFNCVLETYAIVGDRLYRDGDSMMNAKNTQLFLKTEFLSKH